MSAPSFRANGQSTPTVDVTGRVINAISGAPLPRVLVQIGSAAAFTDHDGKFVLSDVSTGANTVSLTKPGYFTSPERTDAPAVRVSPAQLAQPLELRLYPEALITGTVASQDGAPLRTVQVTARRLMDDQAGRRFEPLASVQTDSHGAFRLAVPAGDYQVVTQFIASSAETGFAVLPAIAPSGSAGGTLRVGNGEQQQVELRPRTGVAHTVGLSLAGLADERAPVVTVSTAGGARWEVSAESESDSDQATIHLPAGSYHLSVTSNNGDSLSFGEGRLTVPEHDINGVSIQLAPVPAIPVEVSVDAHASTTAPPSPQELGIELVPEQESGLGREDTVRLETRRGRTPALLPRPGRFRVAAASRGSWYIESATYGGAEVLGQTLTISPGSGSPPLLLIANNVVGSLSGRVTVGGSPAGAWIALLATFPCASPLTTFRAASDGSFSRPSLQPGSYLALALEHRTGANLLDPAVRSSLGVHAEAVTIEPGTRATLDLEVSGTASSVP